jgi:hypothetical protein
MPLRVVNAATADVPPAPSVADKIPRGRRGEVPPTAPLPVARRASSPIDTSVPPAPTLQTLMDRIRQK